MATDQLVTISDSANLKLKELLNEHSDGAVVGSTIFKNMNESSNLLKMINSLIQGLKGKIS